MKRKTMTYHLSKFIKTAVTLVALLMLVTPVFQAQAQNSLAFSVSPSIFDMSANPGQAWRSTIRVINANPYDLTIYTQVVNFEPSGESGVPNFIYDVEDNNSTFASWIETSESIQIPAERTVELPIIITVPEDAQPGGHYAAVLIGTRPASGNENANKVETSQIISSLLFLNVTGDVNELATIRSFRSADYIVDRPETIFDVRIENKGNVHVLPQGEIRIYNMWGQERGLIPVNKQTLFGNVLSNSVRKYSFEWKGDWSIADIGRYKAEVSLTYGRDEKQSLASETAFWVFPWKIIIGLVIILYSFFKLFSWAIKAYIRKMLAMAGVPAAHTGATTIAGEPKKTVSVAAPIEAGMLDLRQRLSRTDSLQNYLKTIVDFAKSYWKFFFVFIAFMIFTWGVIWFVSSALTPNRDYEVITASGEQLTAEQAQEVNQPSVVNDEDVQNDDIDLGEPVITIINRSSYPELAAIVAENLLGEGIEAEVVADSSTSAEDRTVIVFSPSETEQALELSKLLNNAPLSALGTDEGLSTPEITIYLGNDNAQLVE